MVCMWFHIDENWMMDWWTWNLIFPIFFSFLKYLSEIKASSKKIGWVIYWMHLKLLDLIFFIHYVQHLRLVLNLWVDLLQSTDCTWTRPVSPMKLSSFCKAWGKVLVASWQEQRHTKSSTLCLLKFSFADSWGFCILLLGFNQFYTAAGFPVRVCIYTPIKTRSVNIFIANLYSLSGRKKEKHVKM